MPENLFPYSYRAFGLNIASMIPVAGFEPFCFTSTDVCIIKGNAPININPVINKGVLYQANDHEFLLNIDQIATFYVRNGNEIYINYSEHTSLGDISAFIIGTIFGALLHQRKLLPLHASTVIYKDKCLVFAGISGTGKTTLAAAIIKAGGTLVADDISVINFESEIPSVYPAFPAIKIWEDSLNHLGINSKGLEPVRNNIKKFYLPISNFGNNLHIHKIFILNNYNKPEIKIIPIKGMDKLTLIRKHTYLSKTIQKTVIEKNHFQLSNLLASKIPILLLIRPNFEFDTEKLLKMISTSL